MNGYSIDSAYDVDRYLEMAARIEWEEQGSVERPRSVETASPYALAATEPVGA
jgi:hypothetical protein